jgi:uncharacterized protein
MKSGVIDTNILLYAANGDAPESGSARDFLEGVRQERGAWFLTEGIFYEFLRVSTHPRVFPRPLLAGEAMDFLTAVLDSPSLSMISAGDRHLLSLAHVLKGLHAPVGNLFFDIRTAALMREHGIGVIYTADTDFLQFRDLEVINPVARS